MSDRARSRGYEFDLDKLSHFFGARIVPTVGNKGEGLVALLEAIALTAAEGPPGKPLGSDTQAAVTSPFRDPASKDQPRIPVIDYGREIEEELASLESLIK